MPSHSTSFRAALPQWGRSPCCSRWIIRSALRESPTWIGCSTDSISYYPTQFTYAGTHQLMTLSHEQSVTTPCLMISTLLIRVIPYVKCLSSLCTAHSCSKQCNRLSCWGNPISRTSPMSFGATGSLERVWLCSIWEEIRSIRIVWVKGERHIGL